MKPGSERPLAFAVRHINASSPDPIDADSLLTALRSDLAPSRYEHHVRDFLDETDVETLSDLVRTGAVSYRMLAVHAGRYLAPGHETWIWLDERA